jgi:hypothetical protein
VVPEIEEAVPEAFEIDGLSDIGEPEIEELVPLIPAAGPVAPAPPPPTIIVYS